MVNKIIILCIFTILFLSALNNQYIYTQWLPDTRLTYDTAVSVTNEACGRNISVWKNYIHICWADSRSGYNNLFYKRSSDFGQTWSTDISLTPVSENVSRPAIYCDNKNIYIVWENVYEGYDIFFKKSTNFGLNWSENIRITNEPAVSIFPSICVKNNIIHITWADSKSNGIGDIYYKRSDNNGETWSNDYKFTSSPLFSNYFPSVSVHSNYVHIIWEDRRTTGPPSIYYRRSTDYGITWENEIRLTNSNPPNNWMPALSVSENNIHVGWIAQQSNGIFEVFNIFSSNNGTSWSSINKISNGYTNPTSTGASISNKNNFVYMSWSDFRTSNKEIFYCFSTNNGISWAAEQRLTNSAGVSYNVSSSISFNKIYNIWTDDRDGNKEIYFKKNISGGNLHSVSGIVTYADNNQPVSGGYAKALYFDQFSNHIFTIDSTIIQSNGMYSFQNIPEDTLDLMYYQDDDLLQFVPTYYVSTIDWRSSQKIYASENLSNINPKVFRIENQDNPYSISGHVYMQSDTGLIPLNDCILYLKIGNVYKNYGITDHNGYYTVSKLPSGSYNIAVYRMGFDPVTQNINITNSSIQNINFILSIPIGIQPVTNEIPESFSLSQNNPNPFNPVTTIKFGLPVSDFVKLEIFDVLGRNINTLVNEKLNAGIYTVEWNSQNKSSGIYFYRLSGSNFSETRKMILIK